jgi:adenylosuccinate lyase
MSKQLPAITLPTVNETGDYSAIDPFDSRYYDEQIASYLSERARIAYYAYVEAALAYTLADAGVCSQEVADRIEAATREVTAEEVYEQEKVTNHHTKALVNAIKEHLDDEAKPFVHFGATSFDIICTATALQLRDTVENVIAPRLRTLLNTLIKLADDYADTVQVGRTHGQHAVPITFGFGIAEYVSRLGENLLALEDLSKLLRGKFSGAVGAYNALSLFVDDPLDFEKAVLSKVGLEPAEYSTQVIPAENIVRLIDELAITANVMANLSHNMRHLQRTEIAEVRERFEPGQTGSSTMAHKRNPWNFENIISMSKQVTAQTVNANLNISSEHQRDLTDSASSRFYAIVFASVASMAERLNKVMSKLEVDEAAMQRNLYLTEGAIAAEPLYLLLEKYGHTTAHEASKELAHQALATKQSLYETIQHNDELLPYWKKFSDNERSIIESPEAHYTGLAAKKTRLVIDHWSQIVS